MACRGAEVSRDVAADAGVFVAPNWSVGDAPGRGFVEAFYQHLLQGSTLAQATIAARAASRAVGGPSGLAYAVYGHPQARLVREETDIRPEGEALPEQGPFEPDVFVDEMPPPGTRGSSAL